MTPRTQRIRRRLGGFTIIELMITVAVVGGLATAAIPTYLRFQQTARMGEGKTNLAAIRTSQEAYWAQYGTFLTAPPTPGGGLTADKRPWPAPAPGFDQLGYTPEGSVYFDYEVFAAPAGCPTAGNPCTIYTAEARSDLDTDANPAAYGVLGVPPGAAIGLAGTICAATGVYNPLSQAQDLLGTVGPCRAADGNSIF